MKPSITLCGIYETFFMKVQRKNYSKAALHRCRRKFSMKLEVREIAFYHTKKLCLCLIESSVYLPSLITSVKRKDEKKNEK
jgi:hypothetical protein